ncbi:MAG: hypothetical protein AB1637_02105 [Elusimicrobiota bacterium]
MKYIINFLALIFLSSCVTPKAHNGYITKIPNTPSNMKIARDCQAAISGLNGDIKGSKYRCYSTFEDKEEKIVKITCEDRNLCLATFLDKYIPNGCTTFDAVCNPLSVERHSDESFGCFYFLCDKDAIIPDEIIVKKSK